MAIFGRSQCQRSKAADHVVSSLSKDTKDGEVMVPRCWNVAILLQILHGFGYDLTNQYQAFLTAMLTGKGNLEEETLLPNCLFVDDRFLRYEGEFS